MKINYFRLIRHNAKALLVVMISCLAFMAQGQSFTIDNVSAPANTNYYPYEDVDVDYSSDYSWPSDAKFYFVLSSDALYSSDDHMLTSGTAASGTLTGTLPNDPGGYNLLVVAGNSGTVGASVTTSSVGAGTLTVGGTLNGTYPFAMDQAATREIISSSNDYNDGDNYALFIDIDATNVTAINPVILEYSTDGGTTYTAMSDVEGASSFSAVSDTLVFVLPSGALTTGVTFRLSQENSASLAVATEDWTVNDISVQNTDGSFVQYGLVNYGAFTVASPTITYSNDVIADTVGEDFGVDYEAFGFTTGAVFYFYSGTDPKDIYDSEKRIIYDQATTSSGTFEGTFPLQDEATIDKNLYVAGIYGNIDKPKINFEASDFAVSGTNNSGYTYTFDQDGIRSIRANAVDISGESYVTLHISFGTSFTNLATADGLKVQYSTDNGANWTTLDSLSGNLTGTSKIYTIDGSAVSSSTSFRVIQKSFSNGSSNTWQVSDMHLELYSEAYNQTYITYNLKNYALKVTNKYDPNGNTLNNIYPGDSVTISVRYFGIDAKPTTKEFTLLLNGKQILDNINVDTVSSTLINISGNIPKDADYSNAQDLEPLIYDGTSPIIGVNSNILNDYAESDLDISGGTYNTTYVDFKDAGDRYIATPEMDITSNSDLTVSLFLKRLNTVRSPSGTGIIMEYSTDGSIYTPLDTISINEVGTTGVTYEVSNLPSGVVNKTTTFRFRQQSNNGTDLDTWSIQNIIIKGSTNFFEPDYLDYDKVQVNVLSPTISLSAINDGGVDLYPGASFTADFQVTNGSFPSGTNFTLYVDRTDFPIDLNSQTEPASGKSGTFSAKVPAVVPGSYTLKVMSDYGDVTSNSQTLPVLGVQINNVSITSADTVKDGSSYIIYPGATIDVTYTVVGDYGDATATLEVFDNTTSVNDYVSLATKQTVGDKISVTLPLGLDYNSDPSFRLSLTDGNLETTSLVIDQSWGNDDSGSGSGDLFPVSERVGYYPSGMNYWYGVSGERSATSKELDLSVEKVKINLDLSINSYIADQDVYLQYSLDKETWVTFDTTTITGNTGDLYPDYIELPQEALSTSVYLKWIYQESNDVSSTENYPQFTGFHLKQVELDPVAKTTFKLSDDNISLESLSVSVSDLGNPSYRMGEQFVVEYNADGPFPDNVTFAIVMAQTGESKYLVLDESTKTGAVKDTVNFPSGDIFGNSSNPYQLSVEPYVKVNSSDSYRKATAQTSLNMEKYFSEISGRKTSETGFNFFTFDQTGDRYLVTEAMDITSTDTVTLNFSFTYSGGTPSTLLTLPQLLVTTDGGTTFDTLIVKGGGYEDEGYIFNGGSYNVGIPTADISTSTQFMWWQPLNRGSGQNTWTVSNISVDEGESNAYNSAYFKRGPNNNLSQNINAVVPDLANYSWSQNDNTDAVFNGENFDYLFTIDSTKIDANEFPEGTTFTFSLQGQKDPETGEDVVIATTTTFGVQSASIPNYIKNGNYSIYAVASMMVNKSGVEVDTVLDEQVIANLDIFLRAVKAVYGGDENATFYAGSSATFTVGVENDVTNNGTYDALYANLIADDGTNRWLLATQTGIADMTVDMPPFLTPSQGVSSVDITIELSENAALGNVGDMLESASALTNIENGTVGSGGGLANFLNGYDYASIDYNGGGTSDDEFWGGQITLNSVTGRRVITTRDFTSAELSNKQIMEFDLSFDQLPADLTDNQYLVLEYSMDAGGNYNAVDTFPAKDATKALTAETFRYTLTDAIKASGARFRWRQEESKGNIVLDNISFTSAKSLPFDYVAYTLSISDQALLISSFESEACYGADINVNYEVRGKFGADNYIKVYAYGDNAGGMWLSDQFKITEGSGTITFKLPSDVLSGTDNNDKFKFYLKAYDNTNQDYTYNVSGPYSDQRLELVAPINQSLTLSYSNPLECSPQDVMVTLNGEQDYFMYEILNMADESVLASLVYDPETGIDDINIGTIAEDMTIGIRTTSMTSAGTVCNTLNITNTYDVEIQPMYKLYRRDYNSYSSRILVAAGDTRTICSGSTEVRLSVNRTSEGGDLSGSSVEWFRDDLATPVTISGSLLGDNETLVSGSYFARITESSGDAVCSYVTESFDLVIAETPERPVVTVESGSLSFCDGEGEVILAAPEGYSYYKWNNNTLWTGRTLVVDQAGSYYVQVSNVPFDAGCGSSNSVPVVVESQYLPDFQVKTTTSTDDRYNIIDGSSYTGCDQFYIYFYDGDSYQNNNGEVVISKDGAFYASTQNAYFVLDSSGAYTIDWVSSDLNSTCTASIGTFNLEITQKPDIPVITAGGALSFCEGSSVTLTASAGYNYYRWYRDGSILSNNSATITVKRNSGRYQVEASMVPFNLGCYSDRSEGVNVTVYNDPNMSIYSNYYGNFTDGDVFDICSVNDDVYLRSYNSPGLPVTWYLDGNVIEGDDESNGSTGYSYVYPTASGAYYAEIVYGDMDNACTYTTPVVNVVYNVQPNPVTIATPSATEFCSGDVNVVLTADAGSTYYRWYKNGSAITDGVGTSNTLTVTSGGDYTVTVADAEGCESDRSNIITITERPVPSTSISLIEDGTDCASGTLTVKVSSTNSKYNYQLTVRETGANIGPVFTGNSGGFVYVDLPGLTETTQLGVAVSFADGSGCTAEDEYVDTVSPNSVYLDISGNTLMAVISGTALKYTWYRNGVEMRNVTGTSLTVTDAATYSIEVTFEGGCTITSDAVDLGSGGARVATSSNGRMVASTYPNPSSSVVNLDVPGENMGVYEVQIMTLSGQVMIKGEFNKSVADHVETIDISSLEKGIYNMTVVKGKKVENIRIVKQ